MKFEIKSIFFAVLFIVIYSCNQNEKRGVAQSEINQLSHADQLINLAKDFEQSDFRKLDSVSTLLIKYPNNKKANLIGEYYKISSDYNKDKSQIAVHEFEKKIPSIYSK